MWSSDLPLVKQEKPMVYPSPEPSLYSKPSKLWGQPIRSTSLFALSHRRCLKGALVCSREDPQHLRFS